MEINFQAKELNNIIKEKNPIIYELLSDKGKAIFFPKKGILSQSADAKGKKFNATIGIALEEDNTPMRLKSIEKNISLPPKDIFPYAPSYGKPELRQAWQEQIKKKNPSLKSMTSLPITTNALTHALSMIAYLFVNPGEKIILSDKFWGNYKLIFQNGDRGILDPFNMFKENRFDLESLKNKLQELQGKKIILLNFPNNPTGYTPTEKEVEEIINIIKQDAENGSKIIVICDDAYFGLVFQQGVYKESIFSKLADLHENVLAIKVDGSTKEDYVWGFRVGFITYALKGITKETCKALEDKTAGAIRGNISNVSHLSQSLVLNALNSPTYEQEKQEKYNLLKKRFDKVQEILKDEKYKEFFTPLPYNSGYFMCIKLKNLDAEKIRQILLKKYDTGVIAMDNLLRIAFSSVPTNNLQQLFENIYNACKEVS